LVAQPASFWVGVVIKSSKLCIVIKVVGHGGVGQRNGKRDLGKLGRKGVRQN